MLETYDDFIARVEELGFFPFYGKFLDDYPTLQSETMENKWHTGEKETDPWKWKDRAAEEKKLAFGCILGGYKGFISKRLYPLFYAACHPSIEMKERYEKGELSDTSWHLYQMFEIGTVLSTADIRKMLGVTRKSGASKVDNAIKLLQKEFILTVCGNKRKVSFEGAEYGWPSNTYCLVHDWASEGWLDGINDIDPDDARNKILNIGCSIGRNVDRLALSKILFNKWKEANHENRN